jgi:hypothetical protein
MHSILQGESGAQLREMNELNWERFKATLSGESASIRGELHSSLEALRTEVHDMKAEIIKWTFLFWIGSVATLGALILAH